MPLSRLRLGPREAGGEVPVLEDLLQESFGERITIGLLLGTPRPNRKPVLQVFGPDGTVLAFVKVGTDPVTSDLVRREAECLRRVLAADLLVVHPPKVLHAGPVAGLEVLALEPLVSSQQAGRDVAVEPPLAAMAEVAGSQGIQWEVLSSSRFWGNAVSAVSGIPDPALRMRIEGVLEGLARLYGSTKVAMGSWHGDWAPWNMGIAGGRVQVWDWERYSDAVPWGLDVAHFLAQRVKDGSSVRSEQEQLLRERLPRALRRTGDHGLEQDPTIVLLTYLMTISLRFADAAGGSTLGRPFPRCLWAVDLAERVLAEQ